MQDVGAELEQVETTTRPPAAALDDPGPTAEAGVLGRTQAALPTAFAALVDLVVAGTEACGEFRCADCGYGAIVRRALPPCPMCTGTVWERRASRLAG